MEGTLHRYGFTGSNIEVNIKEQKDKPTIVTFIIPNNRCIDLTLEEAKIIKDLMITSKKI